VNGLPDRARFLILTPAIDGADGMSELSRQVVRAIGGRSPIEVWSLASRSRLTIIGWTLARACTNLEDTTVIVMHAHLAPLARVLAVRGARVVLFLVGVEVWRKVRARERRAIERADCVLAISSHTAKRFREANPDVRVSNVVVCHPGIGAPPDNAAEESPAGFALIVGRLWSEERYKGHDWLIDVWPAVRARLPGARLVVVGDGDDRRRLEERVRADGLDAVIEFTGRIGGDRLAALYRAAAFFVMPSTNEGFGLAYLEAMRVGKPCIAVHGAADEIIDDGVSGAIVEAGRSDQLVDAIVRLFTDADWRTRLGAAAAARVERDFTEKHFARRLSDALGLAARESDRVPSADRAYVHAARRAR
jgi:phosphatidyl-myo-inositol dimannoside synthase